MTRVSPVGTANFPSIFEPSAYGDEAPRYSITLSFDDAADLSPIEAAIEDAIAKKWKKRPKNLSLPIKQDDDKFDGQRYCKFACKEDRPPQVVDQAKEPIEADTGRFYPGCECRVSYSVYAWEYMSNCGVSLSLNNVQKVADGTPLDGRSSAQDDFEAVVEDLV